MSTNTTRQKLIVMSHDLPMFGRVGGIPEDTLKSWDETIAEAVKAQEWQPIETAPMNGTKILIWDGKQIYAAWWHDQFEGLAWDGESKELPYRGAWTDCAVASFNYEEFMEYTPTHWMPLPAPPESITAATQKEEEAE